MAQIQYTVTPVSTAIAGFESISPQDASVVDPFAIGSTFDQEKHRIELSIYGLDGNLLQVIPSIRTTDQSLTDTLKLDPEQDAINAGYDQGDVRLLYNFINSLSPEQFYITQISSDRTELRVTSTNRGLNKEEFVNHVQEVIKSKPNELGFRLYFSADDLLIGTNIGIFENDIIVKLYEPLPSKYATESLFTFIELTSDSQAYTIQASFIPDPVQFPSLREPNFNIEIGEESIQATEFLDYNSLYSYPVTSSYHRLLTQLSQSGAEISIDYTYYEDFIHFSSAEERLKNFSYKVGLIEEYNYSASISTNYETHYKNLVKGVVSKFDGYEKYLYFESGAYAWPKTTSTRPYINDTVSNSTSWYNVQLSSASLYDELNENRLTYTVPEFIREDSSNAPYSLFLDMIGQHFDNIWIYAKAITDKHDADNRLNYGVSKELIGDVLKSFGVKLYSSNFSISNLASSFLGEFYNSGSEVINTFVTASNEPTPDKDILSETYKRIYHNLPYLIKTKGTERGLRALINCFGIPSGSLSINTFGGISRNVSPYFAYDVPATQKIKLDYTGSIVPGNTLSQYTSIIKPDEKYNQDLNIIEIGFSPTTYIDNYILSRLPGNYINPPDYASPYWDFAAYVESGDLDIDQYIGDPRVIGNQNYTAVEEANLRQQAEYILSGSSAYNMFDFVRLVKFFDNQLFKMIKDFTPARDVVTTGIIIKPHLLNRSKIKSPSIELTQPEYSASIDTAFLTASDAGLLSRYSTAYTASIPGLLGTVVQLQNTEVEKINGELGGTTFTLYSGSLNQGNSFKSVTQPRATYTLTEYLDGDGISEINYLNGYPNSPGNMSIFWGTSKGGGNYVQYIKIHFTPGTGDLNLRNSFLAGLTSLIVNGTTYTPESITVGSAAALLRMPTSTAILAAFNDLLFPRASTVEVIALPYVTERFNNSDYNALLNNATTVDTATNLQRVDYSSNPFTPINIAAIRNNTAEKADVQEYLHNSAGMVRGRYGGEQLKAASINKYTFGDVTYGKEPVIENQTSYFTYFNRISNTAPLLKNSMTADIRYLIDQQGALIDVQAESDDYYNLVQSYPGSSTAKVSLNSVLVNGINMTTVNGNKQVIRAGARVEPILYSHTGSNHTGYTSTLTFGDDATVPDFRARHILSSAQSPAYTEDDSGYAILFDQTSFEGTDLTYNSGTGELTFQTAPTFGVNFTVTFNIDSTDNKTWFDVSEDVEPIIEYFSGSNWYQLEHSIVSLGGTSRLLNSGTPYTVRIDTESSDNIIKIKSSGKLRNTNLSALNFRVGDKVRARIFCKEGDLEVNGGTTIEVTQAIQPVVDVTPGIFGYWISLGIPGFDTVNGNAYLVANGGFSTALVNAYGLVQTPIAEGYPSCSLPFTVEVGDEIRFRGNETYTHKIVEVITPDSSGVLNSISGGTRTVSGSLLIKLDPPLLDSVTGSINHVNSFVLRRYVEDSKSVILSGTVPDGSTEAGVLTPEYLTPLAKRTLKTVVPDLKSATN